MPPIPRAQPAGPAELALLAPLVEGASLEDWTVAHVEAVHLGSVQMRLEHAGQHLELNVTLLNPNAPPPPAGAGRYAVYYSTRVNDLQAEGLRLAAALALVLQRNLAVAVPPGMEMFPLAAAVDAH